MLVIIGMMIVLGSVIGGFTMSGGKVAALIHVSEITIICGAAFGSLVIMAPQKVLIDLFKRILGLLKGAPYNQRCYQDLFKALYELFMLGRRNGMIALEEHINEPASSTIFSKYPSFSKNKEAVEFLCNGLRPIVDGKIKPEQLRSVFEVQLETMEIELEHPIGVLSKTADAMPGFGIVAAVLGIVLTMSAINGPIDQIGHKVAAALVGTFLGILISYGFLGPLATNLEFFSEAEIDYFKSISASVIGFANGLAPLTAVEMAHRGLKSNLQVPPSQFEEILKADR